ncbi:MAG: hypothetical protein E6J04_01625 [Chloroflexi bacterium]|nr:MAG: hypothetical protein E6J04_01625 [Chloroflexota bacterium]
MKKLTIFIFGGAALLLLAILFGAFFAGPLLAMANGSQTAAGTPPATNPYCQQYLQDLAQRLNVSVSTLQQDKPYIPPHMQRQWVPLATRHHQSVPGEVSL